MLRKYEFKLLDIYSFLSLLYNVPNLRQKGNNLVFYENTGFCNYDKLNIIVGTWACPDDKTFLAAHIKVHAYA